MAVTRHTYATREQVMAAAGWEAAGDAAIADRLVQSHSDKVDERFHRHYFPRRAIRRYDWPSRDQISRSILWLDDDLLEVIEFTASGAEVTGYLLGSSDHDEPPYDRIELQPGATFGGGGQRSLVVEGVWGYSRDTAPAGALASVLSDSATTLPAAAHAGVGVGDLLFIDAEAIVVADRAEVAEVDMFTLVRGAYGTTSAEHLQGAPVTRNVPPGLVTDLVIAECIAQRVQEDSGYNASIAPGGAGTPDRIALLDLRARTREAYARDERVAL